MIFLITGGAGFIGSTLADKLIANGDEIIVVDNFSDYYNPLLKENNVKPHLNNQKYKLYRGDICDKDLVKKIFDENNIDCVVHIAARAGVRCSIEEPLSYVETNIYATTIILEEMREHNVKKLIFASSSSVYGNNSAEKFSEDLNVSEPISPYASTKLACEHMIYVYSKLYGIKSICLRFFTVYGPRQRPDLAIRKFIEKIEKGEPIDIYGDGSTMRDYTYIDDIIQGILSAINYDDTPYEIINLGGGSPVTLNQMILTIEKVMNKTALRNYMPMQLGDVNKTVSDISKAEKLLGYKPQTNLEKGIQNFIEWRKNQNENSNSSYFG